ncbi:MAG: conjugative transfer ATPase, partial [Candidatus Competibacteraceae bacterium]|nr:conjugative transfer ATPase [Candidatus Competibacteraceae bacterium]
DRRLLQRAIIEAGVSARASGRTSVLTEDVARALRSLDELAGMRWERALDMADCLELYTEGFTGQVFNRPGEHWPEADVTILNLGLFANEGFEDKLALSVIGLVNHVNSLAERTRYQDRQIILCFDEAHIVTTHPLLAPYLTKASKVWGRRYAVWLWLATQNMDDFPASARRMLTTLEWWIALYMPPEEIEQLARFRELSAEQKALLQAVRKEPGHYTEGVLLHDDRVALFRNVPPPLILALAQTEQHERAERARIMRQQHCSELEAAYVIARRIEAERGGAC